MKTLLMPAVLSASIHLSAAAPLLSPTIDEAIARGNLEAVQSFLAADPALANAGANPRMPPSPSRPLQMPQAGQTKPSGHRNHSRHSS